MAKKLKFGTECVEIESSTQGNIISTDLMYTVLLRHLGLMASNNMDSSVKTSGIIKDTEYMIRKILKICLSYPSIILYFALQRNEGRGMGGEVLDHIISIL